MTSNLDKIHVARKTGEERFRDERHDLQYNLRDFWRWIASDLVSNATRGVLAEFLVAQALGIGCNGVRDEWAAYDLLTDSGTKIEVKSAAFLQSWQQKKLSAITFNVSKTRALDPDTNRYSARAVRQADVYVFALLAHKDKPTVDPMDMSQWEFYVLPTSELNARKRSQHSITLGSLKQLCGKVVYNQLRVAIEEAAERNKKS